MSKESEIERAFLKEISEMPEGGMVIIRIADQSRENYSMSLHHDTLERFSKFMNGLGQEVSSVVVSLLMRPGAAIFWMMLEHTWFDPTGPAEALYLAAWTLWHDQIWVIGVIPAQLRWTFDEAAKRTDMIVSSGCPMVFDSDGIHQFPIPWARTLENSSDDAPHYKATAEGIEMLAKGNISPQEFFRRVKSAERGMYYEEFKAIKEFYRARGIKHPDDE